jgi:hypothetical protein
MSDALGLGKRLLVDDFAYNRRGRHAKTWMDGEVVIPLEWFAQKVHCIALRCLV